LGIKPFEPALIITQTPLKVENNTNRNENNPKHTLLDTISKGNVFHTPEHYFEKLPVAVADSIHKGAEPAAQRNWVPARIFALAGLAAIVAGILYFKNPSNEKSSDSVLSYEEVVNSGVVAELDEVMIYDELDSRTPTEKEATQSEITAENDHLKEYLIENNTDIALIINEL